jgi:hypothetical protein
MNLFDMVIWVAVVLIALYLLNQLYILITALRWRSQDKLIARALEREDV